jgi:hypothetical protein
MPQREQHFFSRSAREDDDTCKRKRYWSTVWGGRGLSPAGDARELLFGTSLHWALAQMWRTVMERQVEGDYSTEVFPDEECARVDGLLQQEDEFMRLGPDDQWLIRCLFRAYVVHVLPRYLAEWEVLHVEVELRLTRRAWPGGPTLVMLCQPDVILRHRQNRRVRYLEYKSTKLLTAAYLESWRYSPQLAAGKAAAKHTLDLDIDEAVMGFFDKGSESHNGDYWNSPFTNCWEKVNEDLTVQRSPKRPSYHRGWSRFNPRERYQSPADWVDEVPVEVALGQLPESMPVEVHDDLVRDWVNESFWREGEIYQWEGDPDRDIDPATHAEFLAMSFPHNFRQCRPVIGRVCPFLDLCWNPTSRNAPLANRLFVPRTPHHRAEREALGLPQE